MKPSLALDLPGFLRFAPAHPRETCRSRLLHPTIRYRYPAGVLAITFGSALAATALGVTGVAWLALIVAFFSAVQARRRAAAIAALVIGYLI